ncbi:MAG TPA: hypothetical protein VK131_06540, partial [Candidatus Acidoferrales bacterium]|nr:hypothetical protein [Candidatus Acidoferrales bacterium]
MTAESWGLAASLALSGVFFLLAAYVALTRRPPVPQVPAATSDLGPETPAVANLLANGGRLTPDAVPATLLDLAARRLVAIEEAGPGAYGCRLGSRPPAALSAYESRVFELLRRQGSDGGLVPAQALTTGPAEQARGWLRGFEGEVVAEARGAGLCEPRWPPGLMMALAGAALGALALAVSSGSSDHPSNLQMVAIGTSALALFVLARAFSDKLQIVTRTGLPAQARWLALRRYLHDDEVFAGLPPTAVALRDRYLAYGAALGVAAAAVRAIPMGAENDRRAWTNYGGRWQQVAVTYPRGWPPGWGATPRGAAAAALKVGGIG